MTPLLMNIALSVCVTAKSAVRGKAVCLTPLSPYFQESFVLSISATFQRNYPSHVSIYQQSNTRFCNFIRWRKLHTYSPATADARG